MKIAIIGLGLMGGSLAKALKSYTKHKIYGIDREPAVLDTAVAQGAIDAAAQSDNLCEMDVVFVCLYPQAAVDFILENLTLFKSGAVIADICGIKGFIAENVEASLAEKGLFYVGTHPMAGREFSGFAYADEKIFENRSFIIAKTDKTDEGALLTIKELALDMHFGEVVITTPQEHDRIIAYTSQLAHVVSNAYIKSPTMKLEKGFSAGSFKDLTRVAMLNDEMWSSIFLKNKAFLLEEIDTVIENLCQYKAALEEEDAERLRMLLKEGSDLKKESLR